MAVVEATREIEPDDAPLWLPEHDQTAVEQATAGPPDSVEGYTWLTQIATFMFGDRLKTISRLGAAIAVLAFLYALPTLAHAGWANFAKLAFYQAWTIGLLSLASWRVRSISLPTVATFWLTGMFSSVLVVHLASTLSDSSWITPPLEELAKALPLILAVAVGRRFWRHPGLCDLMILGFAVGGGYAFHEDALWERASASGLEPVAGILVPSTFQDGAFVVGHATWTAIVGLAIGLLSLRRRNPVWSVLAVLSLLIVVGDRMAIASDGDTLNWVGQVTFGSKLVALVLVAGAVTAVVYDQRRLESVAARDHLFPTDRRFLASTPTGEADVFATTLTGRYRRFLNGVHTTIDATPGQWPPLTAAANAPVAELARLARAASVPVGPGSSSIGWATAPDDPEGQRFVGPSGWTPYVATDDECLVSTSPSRPEATAIETVEASREAWKIAGGILAGMLAVAALRILTAGDPGPAGAVLDFGGLPSAPNGPPLIPTIIGGLAAMAAAVGLNRPSLGGGWEVGPTIGNTAPPRPDECEA